MYTDFNNFFTVRTRNLWRIKEKLLRPPHLYCAIALPSKTHTTANIDAHVWLIDVMVRQQPQNNCNALNKKYLSEVAVFNMLLCFTRVYMTARSIILTAYHVLNHWHVISCPYRDLGRPLPDFRSVDPQLWIFLVKRFILATDHLLFGNSFS